MENEPEDEKKFIQEILSQQRETIDFFSNKGRPDREAWVVKRFLDHLGVSPERGEIIPSTVEPIDILFRDAKFQIKEILEPNRRRHDEYKNALQKTQSAKKMSDLFEYYTPVKKTMSEAVNLALQKTMQLKDKYVPSIRESMDLLLYLNLDGVTIVGETMPEISPNMEVEGWRSASVVTNDCAFVLFATPTAPDFLRSAAGKICRKPSF